MDQEPIQLTFQSGKLRTLTLRSGSMRRKEAVTEALKKALDACGLDRETVSKELSRLVGEKISVHTLNNWCAEGKENRRFPLEYAESLALITGDRGIIDAAFGTYRVLDKKEGAFFELGMIVAEERSRSKKKRQVLERIGL